MRRSRTAWIILTALILTACGPRTVPPSTPTTAPLPPPEELPLADVTAVRVAGEPGDYRFHVAISSPDQGCDQYADWWEVVTEQGDLVYRRVLLHSHVEEQPFERSGGPVGVDPDTVLWVRAHMHPGGYGGQAFTGTARKGFRAAVLEPTFAAELDQQPPLPDSCAF
jgi:hypothetical protein